MIRASRRTSAATLLVALGVAIPSVAGCGGDGEDEGARGSARERPAVEIKDFKFVPPEIEVNAGTTIRWTNEDEAGHTASSDEGGSVHDVLLLPDNATVVAAARTLLEPASR